MEKLQDVQNRGPRTKSPKGYNTWYDEILEAANFEIKGISPKVKKIEAQGGANKKMDEKKGIEEVGTYDPYQKKYIPSFREAVEPEPEPEDSFIDPHPGLKRGDKLPAESQGPDFDPITRKWRRAGYSEEE